jgi:hypothetical protein
MKFDAQKSFGYPVLRPLSADYVNCAFDPELKLKRAKDGSALELHYNLHCSSNYLNSLIENKRACFVLRVTCAQTLYENIELTSQKRNVLVIPKGEIRHLIEVGAYIVATRSINDFSSSEFNSEFNVGNFEIEEGHVLACFDERQYYVEREVFENITSIFMWADRVDLPMGFWAIDFDDEKVAIHCNPEQRKILDIASQRQSHQPVILNAIILPAVVILLKALIEENEIYSNKRWGQIIINRMRNEDLGDLNASINFLEVAQKLCSQPLSMLNDLFRMDVS